jgi:Glyoxalase/Bleomycin resistance protein/Dioxygenase superfamily
MHHLMMEFYSLDDVGQSYDLAHQEDRVVVKFGRHPNDLMTSFYMRTPSEFLINMDGVVAKSILAGSQQS